jgi:hypothetical protein
MYKPWSERKSLEVRKAILEPCQGKRPAPKLPSNHHPDLAQLVTSWVAGQISMLVHERGEKLDWEGG